jgi:hypothetical protein
MTGPRVCLASIDDHRIGRLNGQWVRLDCSPAEVEGVVQSILHRAGATAYGVGVFDIEGVQLADSRVRALLEPVLGVAGRRLLDS